jgi:hypothetical protein
MIFSQGHYSRWADVVLAGRQSTSDAVPLALYHTSSGTSGCVSHVKFEHVLFSSAWPLGSPIVGTAVSLGGSSTESCNSEFSFFGCTFFRFDTCVQDNTEQGLSYVFEQTGADHSRTFLANPAGNVQFNTGTFAACGDSSGANDVGWIFDVGTTLPNGGVVRISNARFESGSQRFLRVNGYAQVICDGWNENTPGGSAAVVEIGGGSVAVQNSSFWSVPVVNFLSPPSGMVGSIRLRDCQFARTGNAPSTPEAPPSGLITGTDQRFSYQNCLGAYADKKLYPLANATNVTGW